MFPARIIAKRVTRRENKVANLAVFELAPRFSSLMKSNAKKESSYVLLFDESLNLEMKKRQCDVHSRFRMTIK